MNEALLGKSVLTGLWFIVFFAGERLVPAATAPKGRKGLVRLGTNAGLWASLFVLSPIAVVPLIILASEATLWTRPDWLTGWSGLAIDLIMLDLFAYALHRAYHEVPLLWRFHAPHHYDHHLDATSAFRFHPGEVLISGGFRALLVFALATPVSSILIFDTILLMAAIFHHSNIRMPRRFEAALSSVWITPQLHWTHHHAVRADTDTNYGITLTLWDRMFGSYNPRPRDPEQITGVEGEGERSFLRLIAEPFLPKRTAPTPEAAQ